MELAELADLGQLVAGQPHTALTDVVCDSRRVRPGALFVAIHGLQDDGHRYIAEACARGAAAVACEEACAVPSGVAHLQVTSGRRTLAVAAGRFWRHPARRLRVFGVTGTNGKTTTTTLLRAILEAAGRRTGLVGTVVNVVGGQVLPVTHTTPESDELQALLARMAGSGDVCAVLEVSSHALALERVTGVEFDTAVFTNLTRDHFDFHGSLAAYLDAKARLFEGLGRTHGLALRAVKPGPKVAVLNADDPAAPTLARRTMAAIVTYGVKAPADVRAGQIRLDQRGLRFRLQTPQGEAGLHLRLRAHFHVYNALAAAAAALAEGVALPAIQAGLEGCPGVRGRFEAVEAGQDFGIYVDYAHTPDGLRNVLATARALTAGRVICVFGCGGDRDRGKRPEMGRIAGERADYSIITSDNPRSEEPATIAAAVEAGLQPTGGRYAVELDRRRAIALAVAMAAPGDVVVIAGKGHETDQIFKDRTTSFDDGEEARRAVAEALMRRDGMQ